MLTLSSKNFWLGLGGVWLVVLAAISWWSYALVDTNLFLLPVSSFVAWQTARWQELSNPAGLAWQYAGLVLSLWAVTIFGWWQLSRQRQSFSWRTLFSVATLGAALLLAGHNALSRDIFNYLFNAKLIVTYGVDPHIRTALEFSSDPWVRFMHNIHTAAPYGYGWTLWSLIPFVGSGMGSSFLLSYLSLRIWMGVAWATLLWITWQGMKNLPAKATPLWRWSLVAFQPLILLETLLTGHNDIWMMLPAVAAWVVWQGQWSVAKKWGVIVMLLIASISIKYVTVVLLPVFAIAALLEFWPQKIFSKWRIWRSKGLEIISQYGADIFALISVAPLTMSRSQQFHPWYAVWFLVWLPFTRCAWLRWGLLGLSLTSQLRYLPWMSAGFQYSDLVQSQMRLITWSGLALGMIAWGVWQGIHSQRASYSKR